MLKRFTRLIPFALVASTVMFVPHAATAATPACMGHAATIVGTNGADNIEPRDTSGTDVIVTLGGDDTIHAGGGNDIICAGSGDDLVNAMKGRDLVNCGIGNDECAGGYDSDTVWLGVGNDRYDGDLIESVNHLDTIFGGPGRDDIHSDYVSPMLVHGGRGADTIQAVDSYADTVYGGPGADSIDVRDYDIYNGFYDQSKLGDTVVGGSQPSGTKDSCVANVNDTVKKCETVERHDDS